MTLDIDKIEKRLFILKDNINKLNEFRSISSEEFKSDFRNYNSALRLLQVSIEAVIDLGNHIISRKGFSVPGTSGEIFQILNKNGYISSNCMEKCIDMVKFRNRIVHIYHEIDLDMVYIFIKHDLDDFKLFISEISVLLAE